MFRTVFLLIALSIASHSCARIPELVNAGNAGFRHDSDRRDAQFGEGIRDWYRNLKSKLGFGNKDISKQDELPDPSSSNSKFEAQSDRLSLQPVGRFFLDLSNLEFDPDRDWGFRVGNWYVIRKSPAVQAPYTHKPIEEWTKWNEYSLDALENIVKSNNKSADITSTTNSQMTIPETMTPQASNSMPETTIKKEKSENDEEKELINNVVLAADDFSAEFLKNSGFRF